MANVIRRPEVEVYEQYWKFTVWQTDIHTREFRGCLDLILNYIDNNKAFIDSWNDRKGRKSSLQYFRGSDLYEKLKKEVMEYRQEEDPRGTTTRKIINQYVKMGFVNPFLDGYHVLSKSFVNAITDQERKVVFSKIFYDSASFSSSMTIDRRGTAELRFLLNTMEQNRYLTKNDIKALMGTDIEQYEKGYMTRKELNDKYQELLATGFIGRKKIQFGHLTSVLHNFVDFKYLKKRKIYTFEYDEEIRKILEDESISEEYKRDAVKHRIYKEELRLESKRIYGVEQCYVEKIPYQVLIASHIKACAKCLKEKNIMQAYDMNNGLLLSPNIDSYFDKHDISFESDGKIVFGNRVHDEVKKIYKDFKLDEQILNDSRKKYLVHHKKLFDKRNII